MKTLDILENLGNIHFIGIGGINMSGLAEILHKDGYAITGSDKNHSENVQRLLDIGIDVKIGHAEQNLPQNCEIVVYNAAIPHDNAEIMAAKAKNLHLMDRAELLGRLMQNYGAAVCVAGTHGKTTTTSMLAQIFMQDVFLQPAGTNKNPTVLSGGILPSMGGALRIGGRELFVAEACEYHDSFLKFFPTTGIILNVEMDHSDYFTDIHALRASFNAFAKKIPTEGLLIVNNEIDGLDELLDGVTCNIRTFGNDGDVRMETYGYNRGCAFGYLYVDDRLDGKFELGVPGDHNVQNAMAAVACALHHGVDKLDIIRALRDFKGADRRFQIIGEYMGATIVDDYAHHPSEIAATLSAAKNIHHRRLWAVFQPHTVNRTRQFLSEFAANLAAADEIIIMDIYNPAGREDAENPVHARDLADKIKAIGIGSDVTYAESFDAAIFHINQGIRPGDMVVVMGAGNVSEMIGRMIEARGQRPEVR